MHRIGKKHHEHQAASLPVDRNHLAAAAHAGAAEQTASFRGNAAPAQAAVDQVIVLTDATRYVNVTGGQAVRFVVGDRSFNWCFQDGSAHVVPFDLQKIAPQGVLTHQVTTYVADDVRDGWRQLHRG